MDIQTKITKTAAQNHIKNAKYRAELTCPSITGFHLQKLNKGGTWKMRYMLPDEPQRVVKLGKFIDGAKDRTEAVKKANEYLTLVNSGIDPANDKQKARRLANNPQATCLQFLEGAYTDHQKRKANEGKHTINMIKSTFRDLMQKPMIAINGDDIDNWKADFESTHKHQTCVRYYSAFKTMLNYAAKKGVIDHNPIKDITLGKASHSEQQKEHQQQSKSKRRILSKSELTKIKNAVEHYKQGMIQGRENSRAHGKQHLPSLKDLAYAHWFFPFLKIAQVTGMRTGDIYTLHWHHIDFEDGLLWKVPNKTMHHDDPIKIEFLLDGDLGSTLKAWHKQQGEPESGLVFASPVTGKELSKDAHEKHWRHVMKIAKLDKEMVFYGWRHHFISKLISLGVPTLTVAHKVGHKDTRMIERVYGKTEKDAAQKQLAVLSAEF